MKSNPTKPTKRRSSRADEAYRRMAESVDAFRDALVLPTGRGLQRLNRIKAPHQTEWAAAIDPSLLAVAKGEKPPCGRFWREGTKGTSKDTDLSIVVLWLLAFARRPLLIQIAAADAEQAAELRRAARGILHANRWLQAFVTVNQWSLLSKRQDVGKQPLAAAEIIPADVSGSHGGRPDVLIINELTHIPDGKREFAENLMDNAAKVPFGLVVVLTNAGFLDTWQFDWRENARESDRWAFHSYNRPAPWLDAGDIQDAEKRNSFKRNRRLFWGDWVSALGETINADDFAAAMRCGGPLTERIPGWTYVAGLDLGVKKDRSALVVLGVNPKTSRIRVCTVQNWKPPPRGTVNLMEVSRAVFEAHKRFDLSRVCYDPSQAILMAQQLQAKGLNMVEQSFSGTGPRSGPSRMAVALLDIFKSREIDLFPDDYLIRDIGKLQIVDKGLSYSLVAAADSSGHADSAFALCCALPEAVKLKRMLDWEPPSITDRDSSPTAFGILADRTSSDTIRGVHGIQCDFSQSRWYRPAGLYIRR